MKPRLLFNGSPLLFCHPVKIPMPTVNYVEAYRRGGNYLIVAANMTCGYAYGDELVVAA